MGGGNILGGGQQTILRAGVTIFFGSGQRQENLTVAKITNILVSLSYSCVPFMRPTCYHCVILTLPDI